MFFIIEHIEKLNQSIAQWTELDGESSSQRKIYTSFQFH